VTVKSLNTSEWGPPSNGAGVGIIVRWRGHEGSAQPRDYWRHFGALAWHRWAPNGDTAFELRGNGGGSGNIVDKRTDRTIELNTPYIFKMSVQTSQLAGSPANYRFKFWRASDPEPAEWYLSAPGNTGEPDTGSILLVAHQAVVSFGNVTVRPITTDTFTLNVEPPTNGQIIVTPAKPAYAYGERVQIRAQGAPGLGWPTGLATSWATRTRLFSRSPRMPPSARTSSHWPKRSDLTFPPVAVVQSALAPISASSTMASRSC
ncbi:MAG TPA: hypothetical protein PLH39_10550, partial [Promineifilum sp.]|nr:hypothetical protein [Promineifilum sp.]